MPENVELERLAKAEFWLAEIVSAPEAKKIIDTAEAARVWAMKVKRSVSIANHATTIKLQAERKLAEIIDEGRKAGTIAKREDSLRQNTDPRSTGDGNAKESLSDLGVSDRRLSESRAIAQAFTDDEIKEMAEQATAAGKELTRTNVLNQAREKKQEKAVVESEAEMNERLAKKAKGDRLQGHIRIDNCSKSIMHDIAVIIQMARDYPLQNPEHIALVANYLRKLKIDLDIAIAEVEGHEPTNWDDELTELINGASDE